MKMIVHQRKMRKRSVKAKIQALIQERNIGNQNINQEMIVALQIEIQSVEIRMTILAVIQNVIRNQKTLLKRIVALQ